MKIDIFTHIFAQKYMEGFSKFETLPEIDKLAQLNQSLRALWDFKFRVRMMDEYGDLVQILTTAFPCPDDVIKQQDAVEMARIANNEMAEIITKYPDHFIAGVATIPMKNMEAAMDELDRAITSLGFKGVLIHTNVNGKPLDSPEFMPLYEKMSEYDLPIWIHPERQITIPDYQTEKISKYGIYSLFGWPYETTAAMIRLVFSRVLEKYPNLKFITHHCGGLVPFFDERTKKWYDEPWWDIPKLEKHPIDYLRMFYADTALNGSTPGLMCGYEFFGSDNILFGTDMPYDDEQGHRAIRDTIKSVEQMNIPDSDKKKIFEYNAKKLLHMPQ